MKRIFVTITLAAGGGLDPALLRRSQSHPGAGSEPAGSTPGRLQACTGNSASPEEVHSSSNPDGQAPIPAACWSTTRICGKLPDPRLALRISLILKRCERIQELRASSCLRLTSPRINNNRGFAA